MSFSFKLRPKKVRRPTKVQEDICWEKMLRLEQKGGLMEEQRRTVDVVKVVNEEVADEGR